MNRRKMMKMIHPCTLHQMQMMQQESRCTLEGLLRASKGLQPCTPCRCTLEDRCSLAGLEKGLIDDAALKPAPDAPLHPAPLADAPDEALQPYIYYMYML